MNTLLIVLLIVLLIAAVITAAGYLMPAQISLSESIVIDRQAAEIFPYLGDFEQFVTWSPWSEKDPNMTKTIEGERLSFGHKYAWKGNNKVGEGSMEITHIEANREIDILLNFGPRGNSETQFILEPTNGSTLVKWTFSTDLGTSPAARLFGPMMRKFIQKDYANGLQKLKQLVEK